MLAAYIDESGHSADSLIVAMGGVIGNHLHMATLAERWQDMLKRHRVSVFHMSELESFSGEYEGWTKLQREALLSDVFLCLKDLWIAPFGSAVIVEQYRDLPVIAQHAFVDPWFVCFQMCVFEAAMARMWHRDDPTPRDKLAFFHHRQHEFQGRATAAFHYIKDTNQYGHRLGSITSASATDVLQLQLADLVVFEIRKIVENGIYHPDVPTRWPMKRLQERPFLCNVMDFTGRVPVLDAGEFGVFRRTTFILRDDGIGIGGWPINWPDEKGIEALSERIAEDAGKARA